MEKYRDLAVELTPLWQMTCDVVPIVVGCLGCGTQSIFVNCLFMILQSRGSQKTAVLG